MAGSEKAERVYRNTLGKEGKNLEFNSVNNDTLVLSESIFRLKLQNLWPSAGLWLCHNHVYNKIITTNI